MNRWPVLGAVIAVVIVAAGIAGAVALRGEDAPSAAAAEALADDYVEALVRDDCSEYDYVTDAYLERKDTSVEECNEDLEFEFEPKYYGYELADVRVDGDAGEIEIEAYDEINDYTLIASLVVEDGDWKVDDLEEVED